MCTPSFLPVIDHLRAAADDHGNRPALTGRDVLSYGRLYRHVRARAALFTRAGLRKGDRVAIWASKSAGYVVSLYAAMEVGAAYVPMDGSQPADRARRIIAEADPTVLVTDGSRLSKLGGRLPPSVRLVVLLEGAVPSFEGDVALETALPLDKDPPEEISLPVPEPVEPDDIAAILFTSGSTGTPKGVRISHGNLDNFIGWALAEFDLTTSDVLANHAGFHFDLSTFDLFAGAARGAAVWIIPEDHQGDVAALVDGIVRQGVTTLYCVPSLLTMLAGSGLLTPEAVAGLRRVLFAGEVFPIKHLRALARQLPGDCALYNLYGPTETNVCTWHRVTAGDLDRDQPVALGLPLPGQRALLLDGDGMEVTAENQIGELIIAGSCVTPGYFNRVDPHNHANHARGQHATGDLAMWSGGLLHYCGRKDRMLKINGNRVELGEIEAALSGFPSTQEAAVVAVPGGAAYILVAFVSLRDGAGASGIDIKRHCGALLPRYMIPNLIHRLDALPKNTNGKVDYPALNLLATVMVEETGRGAAPRLAV